MVMDYKKSGVDTQAGDDLVDWLRADEDQSLSKTQSDRLNHLKKSVFDGIGGFASLFNLNFKKFKEPLLITCTDGVGTKVKLASHFNDYSTVGQDLVAMCVNDLACTGGEPVLFLDYYATGKLNLDHAKQFLTSVKKACEKSGCLLIGGETAEMPGVYRGNDFDCAGFAIGLVEKDEVWGAAKVTLGSKLLGISSSGFHSNGFSLVRKVFENDLDKYKKQLLEPTHLYTELVEKIKTTGVKVQAAAHITGGGIENIPRVLQETQSAALNRWPWPEIFQVVQERTKMDDLQMMKTLNCGLGFVLVLEESQYLAAEKIAQDLSFKTFNLGEVVLRRDKADVFFN